MREVTVNLWCDFCAHLQNTKSPGKTITLTLRKKPREIDICEECYIKYMAPVEEVLDARGVEPGGMAHDIVAKLTASKPHAQQLAIATDADLTYYCLWCPKTFTSLATFKTHLGSHGYKDSLDAFGDTCPICERKFAGPVGLTSHFRPGIHDNIRTAGEAFRVVYSDASRRSTIVAERIMDGKNVHPEVQRYISEGA